MRWLRRGPSFEERPIPLTSEDRTVHARTAMHDIVRYDRAGKWFIEPIDGDPRTPVKVGAAVDFVRWALHQGIPVAWCEGRAGGQTFDARVRKFWVADFELVDGLAV